MEVIGLILVIVFALISSGDRKKKVAQKAQQGQKPRPGNAGASGMAPKPVAQASMLPRQADEPVMPSNAAKTFEASLSQLKEMLSVSGVPAEGESLMADAQCRGGSMPHSHAEGRSALDDAECAGGSMAHVHSEGVSRAAHRTRIEALDRNREAADEADSLVPRTFDARAMRRAVVMAEVLGRPRALQKH